jgi:hypothetical protein
MKLMTAVLAALLLAPADAARASGTPQPVLEIVTFRLAEGAETAAFLDAARGTEAMLRDRGALVRRFLTVDETGLWTDVIEWTSHDAALTAAEAVMAEPSFQPFMAMIDASSASMRHAAILWRME